MPVKIKDTRKNWDNLNKALQQVSNGKHVTVGFQSEGGNRVGELAGDTVIQYAGANEFGVKKKGIPARPFMRTYFDGNVVAIDTFAQKIFIGVLKGRGDFDQALNAIGSYVQSGIRKHITNSPAWATPNAKSTIYRKLMKNKRHLKKQSGIKGKFSQNDYHQVARQLAGMGQAAHGTKPLIDTGVMLNSVSFAIGYGYRDKN